MARFGRAFPIKHTQKAKRIQVAYDTDGSAYVSASAVASGTWTHNPQAGAGVLAFIATLSGETVSSCKYGTATMSILGSFTSATDTLTAAWINGVATGSATLTLTKSASVHSFKANSFSYNNVSSVVPTLMQNSGTTTLAELQAACPPGAMVSAALFATAAATFSTPLGGSARWTNATTPAMTVMDTPGSTLLESSLSASVAWLGLGVALL